MVAWNSIIQALLIAMVLANMVLELVHKEQPLICGTHLNA